MKADERYPIRHFYVSDDLPHRKHIQAFPGRDADLDTSLMSGLQPFGCPSGPYHLTYSERL